MKFNRINHKGQEKRKVQNINLTFSLSVISFLFLIYYFLFFALQSKFRFPPNINQDLLNPFVVPVTGTKGLELYILFLGTCLYLLLAYLLFINHQRLTLLKSKIVLFALSIPVIIKLLTTNPRNVAEISDNTIALSALLIFLGFSIFILYKFRSSTRRVTGALKIGLVSAVLLFFTLFVILTTPVLTGSTIDFNFFIAPALKLIDGEKLGSFYIQYSLGEILLFKYLLQQGAKLHHMQIVLAVIFSVWFLLYYFLAIKIFKEKFFVVLFLISLVLFKLLASPYHPMLSPQASTMRLDLWLPLFLVSFQFGLFSPVTSTAFSLAYIFDNFFGLFYFVVYLAFLAVFAFFRKRQDENLKIGKVIQLSIPITIAVFFQHYYFGSFFSQSARLVDDLDYWQLNISPHSMFWIILLILGLFLYISLKQKTKYLKENYFLLMAFAVTGLVYFFGRSHENNLMTTSGIILVLLFLNLDQISSIYGFKKSLFLLSSLFILTISFFFSKPILTNLNNVYNHLQRRVLVDVNPIDKSISQSPNLLANYQTGKIFLISGYDAYLNYRYSLKQEGYFSPFIANLFMEDTIRLIKELSKKDYTILLEDVSWFRAEIYNESIFLKKDGLKFFLKEGPSLGKIKFYQLIVAQR